MAHIKKLTDKPRKLPWRAQVRGNGQVIVKMFATQKEAQLFCGEQERHMRMNGLPMTNAELKKHCLADLVRRYLKEKVPLLKSHVKETAVLNKFIRHRFSKKTLATYSRQDVYSYVNERLNELRNGKQLKPSTVARERNSLQRILQVAIEEWGFTNLPNHFRGLRIQNSMYRRKRRLEDGELDRLLAACRKCHRLNEYYAPLAIYLAVETGMRLQEIFNLTWSDIDVQKRRIEIRKSKTDHVTGYAGRTIVLTFHAMFALMTLQLVLLKGGCFNRKDLLFPMSKEAFKQCWTDIRKRAAITGLTFQDLRHEAASMFAEAGLSVPENALMLGHVSGSMTESYVVPTLKAILEKLDRYQLKGKTYEESIGDSSGVFTERQIQEIAEIDKSLTYRLPDIIPLLKNRAA